MDALEKPQAEHRAGTGWAVVPLLLPSAAQRPGLPAASAGGVLRSPHRPPTAPSGLYLPGFTSEGAMDRCWKRPLGLPSVAGSLTMSSWLAHLQSPWKPFTGSLISCSSILSGNRPVAPMRLLEMM